VAAGNQSTTPFVFGVDLDSCLGDYDQAFKVAIVELREDLSARTGVPLAMWPDNVDDFPPNDVWPIYESWKFLRDDLTFKRVHARCVIDGHMMQRMPLYAGAREAIETLLAIPDVEIAVVTHRAFIDENAHPDLVGYSSAAFAQTERWLRTASIHVGEPRVTFHFSGKKDGVVTNLFIDDSPGNITRLRGAGVPTITFDQPYNQRVPGLRVSHWGEVAAIVVQRMQLLESARQVQADLALFDRPSLELPSAQVRRIPMTVELPGPAVLPGLANVLAAADAESAALTR